jgi:hypothetical protein
MAALIVLMISLSQAAPYAGQSLPDVLRDLQRRGLNVVFSSQLVKPEMKVAQEPKAASPRGILDEVLAPHGLAVQNGPRASLVVIRAKKPKSAGPAAPVAGGPAGTITGTVVEARTGAPLPGVLVTWQGAKVEVVTDAAGAFTLTDVPAGPQTLFVSLVGFGLARPDVDVAANASTAIKIPLADGTSTHTETVTVVSDRFQRPDPGVVAEQTMTSSDLLDLRGVIADDPLRAVQTLPGVASSDDFRSEMSVRGSDARHLGLSVDGISTRWLVHAVQGRADTGSVSLINGDVLSRVTLDAGAYPQRRPGRTGGAINFDLREGSRDALKLHLAVSGSSASFVVDGPVGRAKRGSWLVSVRQSYLQWLLRQIDENGDTGFGFTDTQAKLVYDVSPRQQFQIAFVGGHAKLEERELDPGPNAMGVAKTSSELLTAGWRSTFRSAVVNQRVAVLGDRFKNTGRFGQDLGSGSSTEASYLADASFTLSSSLLGKAHTYIQRQRQHQDQLRYSQNDFGFAPTVRGPSSFAASAWVTSGGASLAWTGAGAATVEAGAQLSRSSIANQTTTSPWLLASRPISSKVTLRAGANLSHQFPDFDQITGTFGQPGAVAERAVNLDLGVEYRMSPETRWQVSFYERRERDVMRFTDGNFRLVNGAVVDPLPSAAWRNALDGTSRGVEFIAQRRATTGLSGWIGYAFARAQQTDTARGETFDADFDQRHTLNAYGQYRTSPATSLSAKFRYGSNFPLAGYYETRNGVLFVGAEPNRERLPVYARLDLRANHTFNYTKKRLTLFVEVLNVLGRTNFRQADGFVRRSNGESVFTTEKLFPFVPSLGFIIDF